MAESVTLRPNAPFMNSSRDPSRWAVQLRRGGTSPLEAVTLPKSQAEALVRAGGADYHQSPGRFSDRLNVMPGFADGASLLAFFGLGRPGFSREGLDYAYPSYVCPDSTSKYHFQELIETLVVPRIAALVGAGATPTIGCSRTPRWASPSADTNVVAGSGWQVRETYAPLSIQYYADAHAKAAELLAAQGLTGLYWEGWNEPAVWNNASGAFWRGTQEELFATWAAFHDAVKGVDPTAKVGSMSFSPWTALGNGDSKLMVKEFLEFATARGTPPDWLTWHVFDTVPDRSFFSSQDYIQRLVAEVGLEELPSILTEWNAATALNSPAYDVAHDGEQGAAFFAAGLAESEYRGITATLVAALRDFAAVAPPDLYRGEQGLITNTPDVKKASYFVYQMMSRLNGRRVLVEYSTSARASGIRAMAAVDAGTARVLISRHAQDVEQAANEVFSRNGVYTYLEYITLAELSAYLTGTPLPSRVPAGLVPVFAAAKTAALTASTQGSTSIAVNVDLSELGTPSAYRLYRINSGTGNNPRAAFEAAGGSGDYSNALAAAQAISFAATSTGSGAIPQLTLEDHEVVLVEADF